MITELPNSSYYYVVIKLQGLPITMGRHEYNLFLLLFFLFFNKKEPERNAYMFASLCLLSIFQLTCFLWCFCTSESCLHLFRESFLYIIPLFFIYQCPISCLQPCPASYPFSAEWALQI